MEKFRKNLDQVTMWEKNEKKPELSNRLDSFKFALKDDSNLEQPDSKNLNDDGDKSPMFGGPQVPNKLAASEDNL